MPGALKKAALHMVAALSLPGIFLAACQTGGKARPAVLAKADTATLEAIKSTLADALGRQPIRLGPGDLTANPTLTVLPPPLGPYETASPAQPTDFTLQLSGSVCYLVNADTSERIRLDGVACVPAET